MGAVLSSLKATVYTVGTGIRILSGLNDQFNALLKRATAAPGFPVESPTAPYWLEDPPFPELCDIRGDPKPETDVVIVGSGIAGAAIAKSLLELSEKDGVVLSVAVLEARQLTSGATARNGGHIKTSPYEMFAAAAKILGPERARDVVRLNMLHLPTIIEMAEAFPAAEAREVLTVDVFLEKQDLDKAKREVEEAKKWLPEAEHTVWNAEDAQKEFGVNKLAVGAISYQAGALWPYRLVTSVWDDLLKRYPSLTIRTSTPVTAVKHHPKRGTYAYDVETAAGGPVVRARHVVHATNAFATQLVPCLRGHLTGALAHMSAQKPGDEFPATGGGRSWCVKYGAGFDYVSQRPDGPQGTAGDLMVGGGLLRSADSGADQVGIWDDSRVSALPAVHIRGVMAGIHEPNWGAGSMVRSLWTGILGITGDAFPFVGRLPRSEGGGKGPEAGQWVAAGYNGEGMIWAWLSGTALAIMILGKEDDKLEKAPGRPGGRLRDWYVPDVVKLDSARLKRTGLEHLGDFL